MGGVNINMVHQLFLRLSFYPSKQLIVEPT